MRPLKCCISGCSATSDSHRLFSFPKNDTLRSLWLSHLVPITSTLLGLSKEQLRSRRVCERHFDKHQFDFEGRRLRHSYPCLFSENEIAHGVPLRTSGSVYDVLDEHNYHKEEDDSDNTTEAELVIGRPGEDFHEHPSCSQQKIVTADIEKDAAAEQPSCSFHKEARQSLPQAPDAAAEQPACSFHKEARQSLPQAADAAAEQPSCSFHKEARQSLPQAPDAVFEQPICSRPKAVKQSVPNTVVTNTTMKTFGSKKRKYMKHVTKLTTDSLGHTNRERLDQAQTCARNETLFSNFNLLSKQAQSFLLMQLRLCRQNKMARRFTLEDKLTALALMKQSPKGYKLLENMFALPNKRTLHRLSEKLMLEPGFNPQIFEHLKNKVEKWTTKQKLCNIVFDEVSLTPRLTFNEKYDKIHGFVDVAGERKMRFCEHALVFMLRGICAPWRQCVAYYFCEGTVSAAALQNILKQFVSQVASTGLIPLGIVCDQGSTFRTAIKKIKEETVRQRILHGVRDDGSVNIAGLDVNVFFDPPHLLKGLRNNFLSKDIVWEGKTASWKDIEFIYDLDSKLGHTRALPKLTAHHVDRSKIKKMKVSVATQVFSARTAAMLKYTNALNNLHTRDENSTMGNTGEVVEFFDTLFDSVNGHPGGFKRGKMRKAVKKNSGHHEFWTQAITKIKNMKFLDSSSKIATQSGKSRLVRVPSLDGWITTLESFIRVSKVLFQKYDVDYFYPRNINQDPLENFFGRIRAVNYRNINPDANTFVYSFKSLMLSSILSPHSKNANCEVDNGETLLDVSSLFDTVKENKENSQAMSLPSTSQVHQIPASGSITKHDAIMEKIKVQCSAYTAGFICRKLTKNINCKNCLKTYTSSSEETIHAYIKEREYKMLKNKNLAYPSSNFLILYRDASTYVHNYLNLNAHKPNVGKTLKKRLIDTLKLSWLGCASHNILAKTIFVNNITRLHVHNWCNIINKILNGALEEKYVSKMDNVHKMALLKYKTYKLRKKALNK